MVVPDSEKCVFKNEAAPPDKAGFFLQLFPAVLVAKFLIH